MYTVTVQETHLFINKKYILVCQIQQLTVLCVLCFTLYTIHFFSGREESDNDHQRLVESGKTVLILFWANLSPAA